MLYDPQRRQKIKELIADCGLKAVAGSLTNKHVFRNFHFDTGKAILQPGSAPHTQKSPLPYANSTRL